MSKVLAILLAIGLASCSACYSPSNCGFRSSDGDGISQAYSLKLSKEMRKIDHER